MIEYLVLISCLGFLAFLIPGRHRKYTAVIGWIFIIAYLFFDLPEYFSENNILYPVMAVLSIPFLVITIKYLLADNKEIFHLTRAAAVAFLIYAPFTYIPEVGNLLITAVVTEVVWLLHLFNYPVMLDDWNIIAQNGFRVEIILACTGIQSIAIMLGVAAAVPTTLRQKVYAFILVAPTIYILNLLRNVFVIMAYTGQWFPYWSDIAGNGEYGYESFFWAHNVMAELLALVALILIAYGLFVLIPQLGNFADDLYQLYYGEIVRDFDRIRGKGPANPVPAPVPGAVPAPEPDQQDTSKPTQK